MVAPPGVINDARSLLFTPASSMRMLERLAQTTADIAVVDLEDGVAPAHKEQGRQNYLAAHRALVAGPAALYVRINAVGTPDHFDDLDLVRQAPPAGLVVPKADLSAVTSLAPLGLPIIAALETAAAIIDVHSIAAGPNVVALTLGSADLAAELGMSARADRHELLFIRTLMVLASSAAGLRSPIDVVHLDFRDAEGLAEEARYVRSLGFGAKACIHPDQVDLVNACFSVTDEELSWARRVLAAAAADHRGALDVDGLMVDLPVVARAHRMVERAQAREVAR